MKPTKVGLTGDSDIVALLHRPSCGRIGMDLVRLGSKSVDIGAHSCLYMWLSTL